MLPSPTAARRLREILAPPEDHLDRIAELATHVFEVPIALVTRVDDDSEWIEAAHGIDRQALPRDGSFGDVIIETGSRLVVEDALDDPRFASHPLVADAPGIRFYAGAPLYGAEDQCLGTIAVMDTEPQSPPDATLRQLDTLASLIGEQSWIGRTPAEDAMLHALLSSSSANAVVLDENGVILRTNHHWDAFAEENGLDDRSSIGTGANYLDALNPSPDAPDATADRARRGLRALLEGEKDQFDLVYPCHAPDEQRWFEMQARRLDHPRARAIVYHQNVTARQWRHRHQRILETAVEQAREAVVITKGGPVDEAGPPISYVNPAFTEMTGFEPGDVLGKPYDLLRGPKTEPWIVREMQEHLERGERFEGEAILYRKDDTPFVAQWSMAPVRDEADTLTHWVALLRDVTEEHHMERRLLEAQERERRLIAEEMHHEMGGLLTSLQMAISQTQFDTEDAAVPASGLNRIESIANELSTVVRTLTERLHSRVIDDYGLSEAVARMTRDFREQYGLSIDVHDEIPEQKRLPPLVEKISYRGIYESLKNVVAHADTDHAQLLLNVNDQVLRIHVLDEGSGFDPSQVLSDDQYGLLAIKKRVDRMNGRVDVDSASGEGTRVTITLPLSFDSLEETGA